MKKDVSEQEPSGLPALPVYLASPLDRAKFVKTEGERLELFSNPDILLFFLRLELEAYLVNPKRPRCIKSRADWGTTH